MNRSSTTANPPSLGSRRDRVLRRALLGAALSGVAALLAGACGGLYPQTYLPASHNWAFRQRYPTADRLFNGFDYGHAIVSEVLYARPGSASVELERDQFQLLTRRVLVDPPNVPLDGTAIAPGFTKLAPEVHLTFEWAHMLHRQIYDVLADERVRPADKDAHVERVLAYYRSRGDLALSSAPKGMELMDGQPYSGAFRSVTPRVNGLIWSYHWLQVGLYDALLSADTPQQRKALVAGVVARFMEMFQGAEPSLPTVMPMTAAVAPAFAERYPEAAIIFDNLHSLHDVVSDILASPSVPRDKRRTELMAALSRYRDGQSAVTSRDEWLKMSRAMGVERMGGVAVRR